MYTRVPEITNQKRVLSGVYNIIKYLNLNFPITRISKFIMFSKSKSFRCEYLSKTISVIIKLKKSGQSYNIIIYHLEFYKSSIFIIFYRKTRLSINSSQINKQLSYFPKLYVRV